MILRLLHGWASDASIWARLIPLLPEFDCRADDRGYFGKAAQVGEGEIAVVHSFGAMRALAAPGAMRGLVAINGFDCFTARPGYPGTPGRVLERMIARFDEAPERVVADFRARCGAGQTPPLAGTAQLRADLCALAGEDRRGAVGVPVVSVQAADDPIVAAALHPHLFAAAPAAERISLAAGGHLLPLTAPEACAASIRRMAERLS